MRSATENFGAIALATKDVDVFSANVLDFEAIDARFRRAKHQTGAIPDLVVVFEADADFAAIDGFIPFLRDDSVTTMAGTPKKVLIGEEVTAPKAGIAAVIPLPREHRRALQAGCTPKSSGTFTAKGVKAYIELGANLPKV